MNKGRRASIFSVLLLIGLTGCASNPPLIPVTDPDQRMDFNGFSVLPPDGYNWNWVGREGQVKREFFNTTFAKMDGDRSYLARVDLLNTEGKTYDSLEELMDELKTIPLFQEGPRQENLTLDMKIDNALGHDCVRFDLEAEDHNVPRRPGAVFRLDGHGYYCPHTNDDNVIAHIAYSRRTPKGQPFFGEASEGSRIPGVRPSFHNLCHECLSCCCRKLESGRYSDIEVFLLAFCPSDFRSLPYCRVTCPGASQAACISRACFRGSATGVSLGNPRQRL